MELLGLIINSIPISDPILSHIFHLPDNHCNVVLFLLAALSIWIAFGEFAKSLSGIKTSIS